jgi:hypothetical protein
MTATSLYHTWFAKLRHMRRQEHTARLRTFVWMMVGVMLSRSVHLSQIANRIPGLAQQTSKVRRLSRLLDNGAVRVREWYRPVVEPLLQEVVASGQQVRLLVDGTKVGNGHQLLMVALAYRRRALPIVWTWVKGTRGHSLASTQAALLAYVRWLLPAEASVLVIGDSEFGSVSLMRQLDGWRWHYVLRQKGRTLLRTPSAAIWCRFDSLVQAPAHSCWLGNVQFTHALAFPVNELAYWQAGERQPWLLTTNLPTQRQTLTAYRRRMWVEEMFGDFKRHGFDLESTHLRHFLRLSRLTLIVALLYLGCVAFGASVIKRGLRFLVDRSDRRDLSIFRIGLDMIQRLLANGESLSIPLLPYFDNLSGG